MTPIRRALVPTALLLCSLLARADDWAPNVSANAVWHSNATNADTSADQLDSLQIQADVLSSERYELGRSDTLHLGGHLAGDWWPRYDALLSGAAGGRLEFRHTFGAGNLAPVASIEGAADAVAARETGRRGVSTGITAAMRKRLNDLTRVSLSHTYSRFDARYGVFDSTAHETAFELDRDLNPMSRITFTARYRDGDVVSYATGARPDLAALAKSQLAVTSFGRPMTAYRADARTWSGRLAFVRALDEKSAIIVAYERRSTERKSLRFGDHLLSVGFVYQF